MWTTVVRLILLSEVGWRLEINNALNNTGYLNFAHYTTVTQK